MTADQDLDHTSAEIPLTSVTGGGIEPVEKIEWNLTEQIEQSKRMKDAILNVLQLKLQLR